MDMMPCQIGKQLVDTDIASIVKVFGSNNQNSSDYEQKSSLVKLIRQCQDEKGNLLRLITLKTRSHSRRVMRACLPLLKTTSPWLQRSRVSRSQRIGLSRVSRVSRSERLGLSSPSQPSSRGMPAPIEEV